MNIQTPPAVSTSDRSPERVDYHDISTISDRNIKITTFSPIYSILCTLVYKKSPLTRARCYHLPVSFDSPFQTKSRCFSCFVRSPIPLHILSQVCHDSLLFFSRLLFQRLLHRIHKAGPNSFLVVTSLSSSRVYLDPRSGRFGYGIR
jgi:hypothetical protein